MRTEFYEKLHAEIDSLKRAGTYKDFRYLQSGMSGRVELKDYGNVIMLCSNNYIGLANRPEVVKGGQEALAKYGAGASSVRFICGTFDIHRQLEEEVARFLGMEAALTYTSCWAANTAAIPALLSPGDTVISDELNHASIIDGCRMVAKGVNKAVFAHADMAALESRLKECQASSTTLIVTDGVFSMEGDIARLPDLLELARKYGALLMVDDSHATGVIGGTGRGTAEYYGITDGVDIISGTFGKALGGAGGGFIAGSGDICDILAQKSRPHLFSNALPPVLCGIARSAVAYLDGHPEIVASLMKKTSYMRGKIKAAGLSPLEGDSAIIPILVGDTAKAIKVSQYMMDKGVFAIGFGYPVVPEGRARIRLQVSDALTYEDIDQAVDVIRQAIDNN